MIKRETVVHVSCDRCKLEIPTEIQSSMGVVITGFAFQPHWLSTIEHKQGFDISGEMVRLLCLDCWHQHINFMAGKDLDTDDTFEGGPGAGPQHTIR